MKHEIDYVKQFAGKSVVGVEESLESNVSDGSLRLSLSDSHFIDAGHWRWVTGNNRCFSSFDHNKKYSLPAPIDSIKGLRDEILNQMIQSANCDPETGDIWINFGPNMRLQILNVTGYEMWIVNGPQGYLFSSNYFFESG